MSLQLLTIVPECYDEAMDICRVHLFVSQTHGQNEGFINIINQKGCNWEIYIYIEYSNQRDEIDINHEKHGLGPEVWVKNKDYPQLINLSSEAIHPLISSATVGNPHESTGK